MILTDEEIKAALDSVAPCLEDRDILYSRAIEAAIMAKFEIVGYQWLDTAHFLEKIPSYATEYEWTPLYALREEK